MPKHLGLVLEVIFTPIEVEAGNTSRHNPDILMGAFRHLQNAFQCHFSSRPNQEKPLLELRGLTVKDLKQRLMLTKGHTVVLAIFTQSSLNGEDDKEQFPSSGKARKKNTPVQKLSYKQKNLGVAEKDTTSSIRRHSLGKERKGA